jgi:hypothetical protein
MIDGQEISTKYAKQLHALKEKYERYLAAQRKEANPRDAHLFALEMKHKGELPDLSVKDVVLQLAGELPTYWTDPYGVTREPA